MRKRYKVPTLLEDGKEFQSQVEFDTDKKTVSIATEWDVIEMSFDTLDQLKQQKDDVLKYGE